MLSAADPLTTRTTWTKGPRTGFPESDIWPTRLKSDNEEAYSDESMILARMSF